MNYNYFNRLSNGFNYRKDIYNSKIFMNELQVPINQDLGYLEIFVFTERGRYAIPGAVITIYARQDNNNSVPIHNVATESYPIIVSLPIAHPLGTLIRGPEYYFTTYDLTVEAVGFAPVRVNNVRLFEGITTNLDIDMFEIIKGQYPIPEKVIDIPTHERDLDLINGQ